MALLLALSACGTDDPPPASALPAGYPAGFTVTRECRRSVEHGLVYIRVLVPDASARAYDEGPFPLPAGLSIVKEEHADARCSKATAFAVMKKETTGGWSWQRLDADAAITQSGEPARAACESCHRQFEDRDFLGTAP